MITECCIIFGSEKGQIKMKFENNQWTMDSKSILGFWPRELKFITDLSGMILDFNRSEKNK